MLQRSSLPMVSQQLLFKKDTDRREAEEEKEREREARKGDETWLREQRAQQEREDMASPELAFLPPRDEH